MCLYVNLLVALGTENTSGKLEVGMCLYINILVTANTSGKSCYSHG